MTELILAFGLVLILAGIGVLHWPSALIAAGVMCIGISIGLAYMQAGEDKAPGPPPPGESCEPEPDRDETAETEDIE